MQTIDQKPSRRSGFSEFQHFLKFVSDFGIRISDFSARAVQPRSTIGSVFHEIAVASGRFVGNVAQRPWALQHFCFRHCGSPRTWNRGVNCFWLGRSHRGDGPLAGKERHGLDPPIPEKRFNREQAHSVAMTFFQK
jgi:hypothetical protein